MWSSLTDVQKKVYIDQAERKNRSPVSYTAENRGLAISRIEGHLYKLVSILKIAQSHVVFYVL